ncbi:cell division protein FtsA [Dysgonomonas sp. PH5-45]|uniref:cell division protein FtsA n=1 Tax=unclassified Dysgonomonas TaxID=2630389 RepID=UPI002474FE34|nr:MULTISPECIES: cell division protein FtsA [unclassified Dysgonomonas]MDH6355722.1 cell division protein FtsA [Dysgonomonas sp. PH5-45]MDH6388619.1 cell division protein FtsA [Dysgonomonas sp. PH5-37]
MEQSGFIVAIDLGTSKIVGLLGRKNAQGVISVLASEVIPSDSCVKQGVVYNIDEAAGKIKKLINLLENKSGKKIGKVYVSIAGRSLRAIEHIQTRAITPEAEVTFLDIDQMEQQARQNKPDFFTNYSVVAPEIFLDGKHEEDPIGKPASLVEGRYRLIVGRPNIKSSLVKCITDKNQLDIAGFIVGPVAAGAIVLDEEDKEAGCALVDFGAGTTTVSIYKEGLLRYMSVIPFGGRTITRDVQSLSFTSDAAESYKVKYGKIGKDKSRPAGQVSSEVDLKELNKVIQLREEEIVLNVINQIKESGYGDELDAGIVIIGGASQLEGLDTFLADKSKMDVKKGVVKRLYINNAAELLQNPLYTQCLGLLLFANENCEKREEVKPVSEPQYDVTDQSQTTENNQDDDTGNGGGDTHNQQPPVKEKKKKEKKEKSGSLFDFFGKIQNLGGTVFKDEE